MSCFLFGATPTAMVLVSALGCSRSPDPSTAPATATVAASAAGPTLTPQNSGTTNRLQAVSPVSADVVWASGLGGSFTVTTNGGRTWRAGVVPGAEELQFRDVEGVSADVAYLLAAGTGASSRIYKTENRGQSWKLQFKNEKEKAFYDCFDFWTRDRGIAMSDAVDGRFPVIQTKDGETWTDISERLPEAQENEGAFAASGTCVASIGQDRAWIATGAAKQARIFRTSDGGDSWKVSDSPIMQGSASSGIFTVQFRDAEHGMIAGGDLERPQAYTNNVAISDDGGSRWQLVKGTPFAGPAFGLSYIHGPMERGVVITGPGGAAWSADEGRSWHLLAGVKEYWAVAFANPAAGWLVGTEGRILKVTF